jgi:hypothetical protein
MRNKNLASSVLAAGLIISSPFLLNPHDFILQMLGFIFLQITMVLTSAGLILLRLTSLFKHGGTWIYYFSGTIQFGLCVTDIILLLFNRSIIKSSLLIFLALNSILAAIIFYDIYKASYAK